MPISVYAWLMFLHLILNHRQVEPDLTVCLIQLLSAALTKREQLYDTMKQCLFMEGTNYNVAVFFKDLLSSSKICANTSSISDMNTFRIHLNTLMLVRL